MPIIQDGEYTPQEMRRIKRGLLPRTKKQEKKYQAALRVGAELNASVVRV